MAYREDLYIVDLSLYVLILFLLAVEAFNPLFSGSCNKPAANNWVEKLNGDAISCVETVKTHLFEKAGVTKCIYNKVQNEQSRAIILDQEWKIYQWILTEQGSIRCIKTINYSLH